MKKLLLTATAAMLTLLLTGCIASSVPKTKITGSIAGQPVSFQMPKDVTLGYLTFSASSNGTVSIIVSNLTTRMNPEVITTTGDAQAKMITATGEQITKAIQAGAALK